jgi:hypothetical protein
MSEDADDIQWSITTNNRLFSPGGNHLYAGDELDDEAVDINDVRLWNAPEISHPISNFS